MSACEVDQLWLMCQPCFMMLELHHLSEMYQELTFLMHVLIALHAAGMKNQDQESQVNM